MYRTNCGGSITSKGTQMKVIRINQTVSTAVLAVGACLGTQRSIAQEGAAHERAPIETKLSLQIDQGPRNACAELKSKLGRAPYTKDSIEMLLVETIPESDEYPSLDIDQNGQPDKVHGSCSPSTEPADGCRLSYRLSRDGSEHSHQFPPDVRVFLIRYKTGIYSISTNMVKKIRNVHQLTNTGLVVICK